MPTRFFAFAVPGLAPLVAAELASIPGVSLQDRGFDGRSDVLCFTAGLSAFQQLLAVRLADDVFVEAGRTLRAEGDRAPWIAGRLWRPGASSAPWTRAPSWAGRRAARPRSG